MHRGQAPPKPTGSSQRSPNPLSEVKDMKDREERKGRKGWEGKHPTFVNRSLYFYSIDVSDKTRLGLGYIIFDRTLND